MKIYVGTPQQVLASNFEVKLPKSDVLRWDKPDAIPFIYDMYDGRVLIGYPGETHTDMMPVVRHSGSCIAGRYWKYSQLVTFMDEKYNSAFLYPTSDEMSKTLNKVNKNVLNYTLVKGLFSRDNISIIAAMPVSEYIRGHFNGDETYQDFQSRCRRADIIDVTNEKDEPEPEPPQPAKEPEQPKPEDTTNITKSGMDTKDFWRHYEVVGENKKRKKIIVSESQIRRILQEIASEEIDIRANEANIYPTDAQKEAGNYKMGHISVKGMQIAIENPKGSYRKYKDKDGNTAYNLMHNHYGYFNVTKGKDGDAVDVFIGPDIDNFENVYCVDQNNREGEFDETKVMLGFTSKEQAKQAYLANYSPDWKGFRDITGVSLRVFKKWLYRGRKQRQPFKDYVYIQKKKITENRIADPEKYQAFQELVSKIEDWVIKMEGNGGIGMGDKKGNLSFWMIVDAFGGGTKIDNNQTVVKAVSRALANISGRGIKLKYYNGI